MTLKLLESAVDALDAYLKDNIAAKVAELNTRFHDDMLEEPKKWCIGSLPTSTPESPTVVIHGSAFTPWAQMMAKSGLIVSNDISLVVFVGDDDVENRFRKLCRYTLALVEMLQEGEASMGYNIKLGRTVALTDPMSTQPFLQGMIIPVLLEQVESY